MFRSCSRSSRNNRHPGVSFVLFRLRPIECPMAERYDRTTRSTLAFSGERGKRGAFAAGFKGERLGSVGTPPCRTSARSSRIHSRLVAISICILAFLVSPALALADNGNGNGNGNGNAAATTTTSDPAAATTSSGDPTTTTSAHNASPAPSAPVAPDAVSADQHERCGHGGRTGQRNGTEMGTATRLPRP